MWNDARVTEEDAQSILNLRRGGMCTTDIMKIHPYSRTTINRIIKCGGLAEYRRYPERHKPRNETGIDCGKVEALFRARRSIGWIASDIGKTETEVANCLREMGYAV